MLPRQTVTILAVAVAIWLLLTWVTDSWLPPDQLQRVLNAARELTNMRLTHAEQDDAGNCTATPEELAAEATQTLGEPISVEEYALARMVANEALSDIKGGDDDDKNARIWVALNDARANNGGDIVQCLTNGRGFGPQPGGRKYSTGHPDGGNDPTDYHLSLVQNCMAGTTPDPTGGATHFMDKYGFATNHEFDPAKYQSAVNLWQSYGWHRLMTIGKGLEIWT
jgi:hypothetical protein